METAIDIQEEESRPAASTDVISTKLPNHAVLSRPIRVFTSDELLNLIQWSEFKVQLADLGTGKFSVKLSWNSLIAAF